MLGSWLSVNGLLYNCRLTVEVGSSNRICFQWRSFQSAWLLCRWKGMCRIIIASLITHADRCLCTAQRKGWWSVLEKENLLKPDCETCVPCPLLLVVFCACLAKSQTPSGSCKCTGQVWERSVCVSMCVCVRVWVLAGMDSKANSSKYWPHCQVITTSCVVQLASLKRGSEEDIGLLFTGLCLGSLYWLRAVTCYDPLPKTNPSI